VGDAAETTDTLCGGADTISEGCGDVVINGPIASDALGDEPKEGRASDDRADIDPDRTGVDATGERAAIAGDTVAADAGGTDGVGTFLGDEPDITRARGGKACEKEPARLGTEVAAVATAGVCGEVTREL